MATADRRVKNRVAAEFKVDCIHDEDFIISFSKDISVDGMFIRTENPPAIGQKLVLHFSLDGQEKLEIPARVVWVNTSGSPRDFGMGVKFINPKAGMRRDILAAVNRVAVLEKAAA